jgi:hypothetical protein
VRRNKAMNRFRAPAALAALAICVCLGAVAMAWAAERLILHASFQPNTLGAATNVTVSARFQPTGSGEVPVPITKITAYLPAGLRLDVKGAGTCTAKMLEDKGPYACPPDSRIGFGGGRGVIEIAKKLIHEPFTLDLFLAPKEDHHLVVLAFVEGKSPAFIELVVVAHEVRAPKPYGVGFTFTIPPIEALPEAPDASVERAFITVGDRDAAFYEKVDGKEKLVHVRGFVLPLRCPHGGFQSKVIINFADGSTSTSTPRFPCPGSRR